VALSQLHNALSMALLSSPGPLSVTKHPERGSALSTLHDREKARIELDYWVSKSNCLSVTQRLGTYSSEISSAGILEF